ncbi:MAG: SRPBCC family protein [Turneriella sp.]
MDTNLELKLERVLDAPRNLVWRCWTEPKHLMPWFCPAPWTVVDARIDLHVGGEFFNMMQSPEGEKFPNDGVYLEVVKESRLVWTNAYKVGWLPNPAAQPMLVTIFLDFADAGAGKTQYTARALHWNADAVKQHEAMGFHEGWGIATDQLVAHARTMA